MQFINPNTGWATVEQSTFQYTLIRTTNQGTNWNIIYSDAADVINIQFIDDTLGYAMGYNGNNILLKTTNSGYNWTIMQSSESYVYSGFYFVNKDTGWVNAFYFPSDVTLMTTDGFQTLQQISTGGGGTPATLYFFKEKYNGEYCGYILGAGILNRTTNSGYNWQQINVGTPGNINSFSFINKDTGWIVIAPFSNNNRILKTSNGGINWISQYLDPQPSGRATNISAVNSDKIWCGRSQNYIMASDDSGINWGKQISQITDNSGLYMYDTSLGFAWSHEVVRTTNGGGPITSINKISNEIPNKFILKQNYPNPFNSSTVIEFEIPKSSNISLILYDILGKEVLKIIYLKELKSGIYKVIINLENNNLSSGIYFYRLTAFEKENGKLYQLTKKLVYNK